MAKRFKLRISRVIQSCRSKDPSTFPDDPVPSFLRPSPVNSKPKLIMDVDFPPFPTLSKPHRSSYKSHVSSFTSLGCGFGSKPSSPYATVDGFTESPDFKWKKEEKWHVVAKVHVDTPRRKIYNTSASENDDVFLPPKLKTKRRSNKKKTTYKHRNSITSSAESGLFSSEGGDHERETLVASSRSFSTESSSEYNPQLQTINETPTISIRQKKNKNKKKKKNRGNRAKIRSVSTFCNTPEMGSPARLSVFQKLIPCGVEGKVRESFAIVKKSEDPYEDFKRSMMDMILEKHMFEERDLEQLLQCFLSLNSINHHGVIFEAFSEIWDALFSKNHLDPVNVFLRAL